MLTSCTLALAQIPLHRLCDKVQDKFLTKSRTCRGHRSWKSTTQFTSPTFMICVADFRDLCPQQSPQTLSPTFPVHCKGFVADLSQTLPQTPWHVDMVCVRNFRDLCWRLSPKLHGFMICHRLCLRLSWFVSTTFPAGKFRSKSA